MAKNSRKPPADLVFNSIPYIKRRTWKDNLSYKDKVYLGKVIMEIKSQPSVALHLVARALIKELNLTCHENTVVRYLKGRLNESQKS